MVQNYVVPAIGREVCVRKLKMYVHVCMYVQYIHVQYQENSDSRFCFLYRS